MAAKWQPAPLPDGSYADAAHPFTSQDLINYIPEYAPHEGTRGPVKLMGAPGLQEFSSAGTAHRGARNVEGKLFVVSGTGLYQIGTDGSATSLGVIPGAGQVSMSHNQIANGNQLLIVNGSSGYIWNTVTSTLTRITSASYPGAIVADFVGQLFVQVEPLRRYFFNSALVDGLTYNALETYEAEASPDRLVSLIINHRELYAFGEKTVEVFDYTGTTNALFSNKGITIPYGLAAPFALANLDNSTFFLGSDGTVYRLSGYDAARVSTHCIEQDIATCDISKAYAFTYEDRGHKVFYLTFPDGHTWGYDCATQKWHRRESYGLTRWRLATLVFWNNAWYGGEWNSGRIFKLSWDYMMEGCDEHVSEYTTGVAHNNQNRMQFHGLEIVTDTGSALSVCAPIIPLQFYLPLTVAGNLPNGAVGDVVSYQYRTIGGQAPVTFAISSGALPTGLTMTSAGLVTGTTTTSGAFSWTVRATDNAATTADLADTAYEINIVGDPPDAAAGAYTYALTGTGGTAPYTFLKTGGTLPTGCTLSSAGVLSGTATASAVAFTVKMTDALGVTQTKSYTVVIGAAVTFESLVLAANPIAWWKLQDSGATAVEEISARNGTYNGSYTLSSAALRLGGSNAVKFNSAQGLVNIPYTTPLDLAAGQPYSVEAWIRQDSGYGATYGTGRPIILWGLASSAYGFSNALFTLAGVSGGGNHYVLFGGETETSTTLLGVTSTSTITPSTIYHVVWSFDGTNMRLIVNGVSAGYAASVGVTNPMATISGYQIGGDAANPLSYGFDGVISDVIVYRSAVTVAEALARYNAGHL